MPRLLVGEVHLLQNSFVHIQGIGLKTERRLWEQGIRTWHQFLGYDKTLLPPPRDERVRQELASSIEHLRDIQFFHERLPAAETWRLFETFEDGAVYLDIETDGGYLGFDEITVIGLRHGQWER
jgi:hypothetical protein